MWRNDTLEFVPTAEGRFVPKQGALSTGRYEYSLKDQLGNLRVACTCDTALKVTQIVHQDPWGYTLPIGIKGTDRYKFLGREEQAETGWVDLMKRFYDPSVGRFLSVDPLPDAAGQESLSTYQYGWNNPIRFSDPDGMAPRDWINWRGNNGQQHITYHSGITTKAQAEAAGYKNVYAVFGKGTGHTRSTSDKFSFQENGKFSVNGGKIMDVSDGGLTTKGGTYINKGLTGIEQLSTGLQTSGDIITAAGLATA